MSEAAELIPDIWARIERALEAHAPEVRATLRPGASAATLAKLEAGMKLTLPEDLRRSLEIHDGQEDPSRCLKLCGVKTLCTSIDILRDWTMLTKLGFELDIQNGLALPAERNSLNGDWWRRSCIPFADCEGYYSCVDTIASARGPAGRIVEHTHDDAMEETRMPSFADWLGRVAGALDAGRFRRDEYEFFTVDPAFAYDWNS